MLLLANLQMRKQVQQLSTFHKIQQPVSDGVMHLNLGSRLRGPRSKLICPFASSANQCFPWGVGEAVSQASLRRLEVSLGRHRVFRSQNGSRGLEGRSLLHLGTTNSSFQFFLSYYMGQPCVCLLVEGKAEKARASELGKEPFPVV